MMGAEQLTSANAHFWATKTGVDTRKLIQMVNNATDDGKVIFIAETLTSYTVTVSKTYPKVRR